MKLKILNIVKRPSKYGGFFYYIYFKSLNEGNSYKTCVAENYRNYKNWKNIIQEFYKTKKVLITNVEINGNLVNADSIPKITYESDNENQMNIFDY